MSTTNRAALFGKSHKVLKKHYQAVQPSTQRSVLEHMLYAACLESASHEQADEALAKLQELYFDWNEVRVTTVSELAEVMSCLPDPERAAARLKRTLQALFEEYYEFDLDFLKKQNLGKSVKDLEKHNGIPKYVVAYTAQNALGGHSIPLNQGALKVLVAIGAISEKDVEAHRAPGLERAISKTKGVEYGSLLHQLGVDFEASPFSPRVRGIILEIAPDARERLPKRVVKRKTTGKASSSKKKTRKTKAEKSVTTTKKSRTKKVAKKTPKKVKAKKVVKKKTTSKKIIKKKPK